MTPSLYCATCGHSNEVHAGYCAQCGSPLAHRETARTRVPSGFTPTASELPEFEKTPEASFDPLASTKYYGAFWRTLSICGLLLIIFVFSWGLLSVGLAFVLDGRIATYVFAVGAVLAGLTLGGVFLFRPIPVLLSEWKHSFTGQGANARDVLDAVEVSLKARRTPRLTTHQHMAGEGALGVARRYVEVRTDIFAGYVASFPYGRDLYVGWTFWLYLAPATWLRMVLIRSFRELTLRGTELHVSLEYEPARALRGAIDLATREALEPLLSAVHEPRPPDPDRRRT